MTRAPPGRATAAARGDRGFTLIELVVSIVVLSIAVAGVVAALSAISVRSADELVSEQANAIASAYLNEVLQKPFGANDGQVARANLDVVDDYAGLSNAGVRDQTGAVVPGLGQFTVAVSVTPAALGLVPAAEAREVDVTVTHPSGVSVVLSGFRTLHP
ncbi:MAG TPA: type II secretion system protein [Steroidobacteraceae bacterium]|nr:type II secretion system protein [Steroidobacteraceae bacterium]